MNRIHFLALTLGIGLVACGDDALPDRDAATADAGITVDATVMDAGAMDSGSVDAGSDDAGRSDGGSSCGDADDDGICDAADRCPGFDDRDDADTDGTPDGCDCDAKECLGTELCREQVDGAVCLPDMDGDGYEGAVDCDDDDPDVHPGATEVCNGVDDDCDPLTDEPAAVLREGVPQGDLAAAIGMGGLIEICGAFPLRRAGLPRIASPVTVRGLSADAQILYESGRLAFESEVDATFESLAIRADLAAGLAGIHVIAADLRLTDVEIDGLQTAILADRSTVDMTGGRIARSREGAGVYLDRSTATFTNVVFEDNETRDSSRGGGALFASLGSTVTLTGCALHDNRNALGVGGAVYLGEAPSQDWGSARLTATTCDWGTGATDNSPDDLVLWYGPGTTGLIEDDVTMDVSCVANSAGNGCTAL